MRFLNPTRVKVLEDTDARQPERVLFYAQTKTHRPDFEDHFADKLNGFLPQDARRVAVIEVDDKSRLESTLGTEVAIVVNMRPLNGVRKIDALLEAVNTHLPERCIYVLRAETLEQRRARVSAKYPHLIANLREACVFICHRVLPKLPGCKRIYLKLSRGRKRLLSKAEVLGRACRAGFRILDNWEHDGHLYAAVRRAKDPDHDRAPSYGPLFPMLRIGANGRAITVYKIRTMYPYSEYLQEYVHEKNALAQNGKIRDDFRVTRWGRFLRRWWIDEIPMIANWLCGDLKLVGVRPLSEHYLELYPQSVRTRRLRHKPGLLPALYADLPSGFKEIVASENRYLKSYEQAPRQTDMRYVKVIMANILSGRARSA